MALNPGILNTSIIGRGARESRLDIKSGVDMYHSVSKNKRQKRLDELTFNAAERKLASEESFKFFSSGSISDDELDRAMSRLFEEE